MVGGDVVSERGAATVMAKYEAERLPGETLTEWRARRARYVKDHRPGETLAEWQARQTTTDEGEPGRAPKRTSSPRRNAGGRRRPPARRRRAPRSVRAAARRLEAPVRAQVTSGLYVTGLALAVVAIYLLLTTAEALPEAVRGAANGPAKALRWLADPGKSIRYAPGYTP